MVRPRILLLVNCIVGHHLRGQVLPQGTLRAQGHDLGFSYLRGQNGLSVDHWGLASCCCVGLHLDDVLLHGLDVDIIVEMNDILLLPIATQHLHVYTLYGPLRPKHLSILVNDVIERYLQSRLDLAHPVYSGHHQLIEMSVY